ncbi:MAG TPA: hypothetical protein PLZ16_00295 [Gammaproteobacteria bacterium]|nr:hypothetical protein [Gammaproteobacteria bacterium]
MIDDAISRSDISLDLFRSREEVYLASFRWNGNAIHTFGRKCGSGAVFLLKNNEGTTVGFITFSIDSNNHSLTINTGGTTGKYRNRGYGIPLLDSFNSLMLVMGITNIEITIGHNNPFVLMLITQTYGFGPVEMIHDQAMIIGTPDKAHPDVYPVYFIGEEARRLIAHGETEEPPDPFGPRYHSIDHAEQMPLNSATVYVNQSYRIMDRIKLYQRIFRFLPKLYHHPDPALPRKRIVWKSSSLSTAQSFLLSNKKRPTRR